jgi:hypothetical protein
MDKETLRMALEALEAHADIGIKSDKAITAIKQALAAPESEPVAWRWTNGKNWLTYGEMPHDRFESTPLYTTPPAAQRQWVALTDEDVSDLCDEASNFGTSSWIRRIEAKLKEKNT